MRLAVMGLVVELEVKTYVNVGHPREILTKILTSENINELIFVKTSVYKMSAVGLRSQKFGVRIPPGAQV